MDMTAFERRGCSIPEQTPPTVQGLMDFGDTKSLPDPMEMIRQGAQVFLSHSGGKDGQAMIIHVLERLKVPTTQCSIVHADLGECEWENTEAHARSTAIKYGVDFFVTRAKNKAQEEKNLLDYAETRGKFFSSAARYCTSDFKRSPIRREINRIRELIDHKSPFVLNAMGIRAEESAERAKSKPLEYAPDASCPPVPWEDFKDDSTRARPRAFFNWHPIHHFTEAQVFATIAAGGEKPHWAYTEAGARRLSCLVCCFSSEDDIRKAVTHSEKGRAYARRLIEIEEKIDHTILPPKSNGRGKPVTRRFIKDVVGDLLNAA